MARKNRNPKKHDEWRPGDIDRALVEQLSAMSVSSLTDPMYTRTPDFLSQPHPVWHDLQARTGLQMNVVAFIDPIYGWHEEPASLSKPELNYLSPNPTTSAPSEARSRGILALPYLVPRLGGGWGLDPSAELKSAALEVIRVKELQIANTYPYFVRACQQLQNTVHHDVLLSAEERENNVVFAPCGELSFFCLGWLLRRILPPEALVELRGLRDTDPLSLDLLHRKFAETQLTEEEGEAEAACGKGFTAAYPIRNLHSIEDVLNCLGLLPEQRLSRRLWMLLSWLHQIGEDSLGVAPGAASGMAVTAFGTLERVWKRRTNRIRTIESRLRRRVAKDGHDGLGDEAVRRELEVAIGQAVALAVSDECTAEEFKSRARFSPEAHLTLRVGESFERSWLVVPVLRHTRPMADTSLDDQSGMRTVGFVLSTLNHPDTSLVTADFWLSQRMEQLDRARAICQAIGDTAARTHYWPQVLTKMVEERELGLYLSTLVHDIQTQVKVSLLRTTTAAKAARESLSPDTKVVSAIDNASRTLRYLHGDMRDLVQGIYARDLTPVDIDLQAVVARVASKMCERMNIEADIIRIEARCNPFKVHRSVAHMIEGPLLREIFTNAIRHAPDKDGPKVEVGIVQKGEYVFLTITNLLDLDQQAATDTSTKTGLILLNMWSKLLGIGFESGTGQNGDGQPTWESTVNVKDISSGR